MEEKSYKPTFSHKNMIINDVPHPPKDRQFPEWQMAPEDIFNLKTISACWVAMIRSSWKPFSLLKKTHLQPLHRSAVKAALLSGENRDSDLDSEVGLGVKPRNQSADDYKPARFAT